MTGRTGPAPGPDATMPDRVRLNRRSLLGGLILGGPALLLACGDGNGSVAQSGGAAGEDRAGPTTVPTLTDDTAVIAYGEGPTRYAHLDLPSGEPPRGGWPVAVLIHGGFWRTGFQIDLMFGVARSLHEDGWATWNIQYSSVGDPEGGWPGTFADVAAAIDHVDVIADAPIDRSQVLAIGHSAGGHLALWAASRDRRSAGAPGSSPVVPVTAVVSQAGVTDLLTCVDQDLGSGACLELMGERPNDDLARYLSASPIEQLPLGVPTVLIHGTDDDVVPIEQSERYAYRAAAAGDDPMLLPIMDADHFAPITPGHEAWENVRPLLAGLRG